MKKILFALLILTSIVPAVFAEIEDDLKPAKTAASSSRLVDMDTRRTTSKLDELERRVRDLERYQRSQDERIRNLERSINDLKRLRS